MCGIVGFVKKNQEDVSGYIDEMLESIKHRGPDAQNYYSNNNVTLGHTRLSIVDIENGHQPYIFKNYVLVFNGEIYNHEKLKIELENKGYSFETNSDTEVLVKLYDCYGDSFTDKLRGMYAFVILDKDKKELTMSRDFFGIKPMYIYQNDEELFFSSEMITLIRLLKKSNVDYKINVEAQKEYLKNDFIKNHNIVKNAFELPKGKVFRYKDNKLTEVRTTKYYFDVNRMELSQILKEEIEEQQNADVDVGVLLSGGIDSSLITSYACENKSKVNTYSISFEDDEMYDESKYSREVAEKFNTNHREFKFSEETLLNYLPQLIETIDIPVYDPAMLPMLYLCENVSKTSKVVLSGDGGDEMFLGYTHHRILKYRKIFKLLSNLGIKKNIISTILIKKKNLEESKNNDQDTGLNLQLLRKTDLCSMRYGVEVRVPFLSKRVYSYSKSKNNLKFINLFYGKLPLRELARKRINKTIAYKKKQGFRVPIKEWVNNGVLGEKIVASLTSDLVISSEVISKFDISKMLAKKDVYYKELFSLYLLNCWLIKIKF
ncbi:MAG: asparagine synthase (glutamine-hydrolyzing) [Flavobacteriaceae bacterium]|nr:asparagine synthase (glutamine-hydrolyzing) [Flavobacteriaceae bacterium]